MSNPFSIKLPIFLTPDDDDSYYSAMQTFEDNVLVDDDTLKSWKEKAGQKKLKLFDCVELGYLRNIGNRGILYSPLQEGKKWNTEDDCVAMAVYDYVNKLYCKNPEQFVDIRRDKKYPPIIPFDAMEEVWSNCDEDTFSRWKAIQNNQEITQELGDVVAKKSSTKKTLKI